MRNLREELTWAARSARQPDETGSERPAPGDKLRAQAEDVRQRGRWSREQAKEQARRVRDEARRTPSGPGRTRRNGRGRNTIRPGRRRGTGSGPAGRAGPTRPGAGDGPAGLTSPRCGTWSRRSRASSATWAVWPGSQAPRRARTRSPNCGSSWTRRWSASAARSSRPARPVSHRGRRPAARRGTGPPADTGHPCPLRRARPQFPAGATPPARRRGRTEPGPVAPDLCPGRGRRHGSRRHGGRRHGSRRHGNRSHGNRSHGSRRHRDRRDRRAAPGNPAQARHPRDWAGGYAPGEEAGRRHPKGCLSYSPFPSELGGTYARRNVKMTYAPEAAILHSGRLIRRVIGSRRSPGRPPSRRARFARSSHKVTGNVRGSWRP